MGRTGTSRLVAGRVAIVRQFRPPSTIAERYSTGSATRWVIPCHWVAQVTMTECDEQPVPVGYNRRFNDCRKRVHIVRFCMLGAKGAKTFTAACSAAGVDGSAAAT